MREQERPPIASVDYPRTIQEFDQWFPSEEACASYLARVRWPDGFVCPVCGGGQGMVYGTPTTAMRLVPAPDFGDCGHSPRRYSEAIARLVPGNVARNEPEERCQRSRS